MSAKSHRLLWILIISLSPAALARAAAGPGYHVITSYKVGGEGGWDYLTVDAAARRLYISRGTHVIVLDSDSGKSCWRYCRHARRSRHRHRCRSRTWLHQQRPRRHRLRFRSQDARHQQQDQSRRQSRTPSSTIPRPNASSHSTDAVTTRQLSTPPAEKFSARSNLTANLSSPPPTPREKSLSTSKTRVNWMRSIPTRWK